MATRRWPSYDVETYVAIARELREGPQPSRRETATSERLALAVLRAYRAGPAPALHIAPRLNLHEVRCPQGKVLWGSADVVAALNAGLKLERDNRSRTEAPAQDELIKRIGLKKRSR